MPSILTNQSALVALQSLTATQKNLQTTQNRISTGLKVSSAADDASTWQVATQMRTDSSNLQQVSTNLGTANSLVGVALNGATTIATMIQQIQNKLTAEASGYSSTSAMQSDIAALVSNIQNIVNNSSFNGVNFLSGGNSSMAFASGVVSNSSGVPQVSFVSVTPFTGSSITNLNTTSGGGLAGLSAVATSTVTSANLQSVLQTVASLGNAVAAIAAQLGSAQSNIQSQQTFVNGLVNSLQSGVSSLVDADMTTESARLSALQTQQSLGTQSLSIANQAPQSILRLFQ